MTSPTGAPNNIRTQLDFTVTGAKQAAADVDNLAGSMRNLGDQTRNTQNVVKNAGRTGGGGIGAGATVPTFLQFSLFPFAGLAQQLGAGGLAQGLFAAGNIAGILDVLRVVPAQLARLSTGLVEMGGIIGSVASAAYAALAPLGGVVAGLGAILAVAAPIVLVVGGIAAIISNLSSAWAEAKQRADEYIDRQLKINELIAGGGTFEDFQTKIDQARAARDAAQKSLEELRPLYEQIQNLPQIDQAAVREGGNIFGQLAQQFSPAIKTLDQQISDATQGQITSASALYAEYQRLTAIYNDQSQALSELAQKQGDPQLLANTTAEANQKAAEEEAKFHQERLSAAIEFNTKLRGLTFEQIGEQLQALETERQSILQFYDAATDEEKKGLDKRLLIISEGIEAATTAQQNFGLTDVFRVGQKAFEDFFSKVGDMAREFARQNQRILEERVIAAAQEFEDFSIRRLRTFRDFARQQEAQDIQDARREEQLAVEQERRQEDLADRIRKIMLALADDLDEAVGFRDALGYVRAQKRAQRQLDELKEDEQRDDKRRKEDLEREDKYREEDRRRALEDFRIRLADEDADRALRLQRLNQQQQREDYLRQQDYNYRYQQLYQQVARETGLYDVLRNNVMFSLESAAGSVNLFVARVLNAVSLLNTSPQATQAINQQINRQVYTLIGTPYNFP